jgi:alkylation response protein AidB-like acyl-CoA dehydrogenase
MPLELTSTTPEGARLVALAEDLGQGFAAHAAAHDRDGRYPHACIAVLRDAGYFAAPIPEELGGLGVASVHDLVVASSRLARGEASVAIGVNMHLAILGNIVRRHAIAVARGDARRTAAAAAVLRGIVEQGTVIAAAISEPGQELTRPKTTAVRTDAGWRVDGHKIFCTMSPAATVLYVAVTAAGEDASERYAYAQVPTGAAGVTVHDDWDALGMRASGSHSVSFSGVELPAEAVTRGFAAGDAVPYMDANLTAGLFHAAASLGIAEAAGAQVAGRLRSRSLDARTQVLLGENAVDLAACRAALSRGAALVDAHHAAHPAERGSDDEIGALFAEAQAVKTFVNAGATRIVDRALACSGGAGYLNGSPLSRAYRDVRAGAFMHPLGANRAYEFLSRIAVGERPVLG